eukprot:jgi/Mesvir1/8843/Mv02739-RA.1
MASVAVQRAWSLDTSRVCLRMAANNMLRVTASQLAVLRSGPRGGVTQFCRNHNSPSKTERLSTKSRQFDGQRGIPCNVQGMLRSSGRPLTHRIATDSRFSFRCRCSAASDVGEDGHHPVQTITFRCPGSRANDVLEVIMDLGICSACTIQDTYAGTEQEQQIYRTMGPRPWEDAEGGKTELWENSRIVAYFKEGTDPLQVLEDVRSIIGDDVALDVEGPVAIVQERDWVQQVKDSFRPIQVTEQMWIVPEWSEAPRPDAVNIFLEPGLAFGTGEHSTTRLCLQFLQAAVKPGDAVMDYGTGSGVLAIGAIKLGAGRVVGTDIDAQSITAAQRNAALNPECKGRTSMLLCEDGGRDDAYGMPGSYDVVVANILINPLLALATRIAGYARPGGAVGLTGILINQVPQIKAAYGPFLTDMQVLEEEPWALVYGKRR